MAHIIAGSNQDTDIIPIKRTHSKAQGISLRPLPMVTAALAAILLAPSPIMAAQDTAPPALSFIRPGPLETYKDWVIGCDNINHCTAASLLSADGSVSEKFATLYIRLDAGPYGAISIEVKLNDAPDGTANLLVDGVKYVDANIAGNSIIIADDSRGKLIPAMVRGKAMQVQSHGRIIGTISLSGMAAALRYMDARQGRAGTVTALVATGNLVATSVKAAPSPPVIRFEAPGKPNKASARLWQGERGEALAISGCAAQQTALSEAEITPISDKEELVLIPCGSGAYNMTSVPLIATGKSGRRSFRLASFDLKPSASEAKRPMLINAMWDGDTATLASYAKGRGIGDCGITERYVWDGTNFRMIEKREMKVCRGAWDWIRIWTAETVAINQDSKKAGN